MTRPRIAVITACYGHAHFLGECIRSVQASTYRDYAHVIVDDASPDDTWEIAGEAARSDDRIFRIRQPRNLGLAAAQNAGITSLAADWYLKLDADDWIAPEYLAEILDAADRDPRLNVILSPAHVFGDRRGSRVFRYPDYDRRTMHKVLQIPGPAALRREVWEAVGGFDERLRLAEDWDFWVRAERTVGLRVHQLDKPRWHYRQHDGPRVSTAGIRHLDRALRHLATHKPGGNTLDWRAAPAPDPVLMGHEAPVGPDHITLGDDQWSRGYWERLGKLPGLLASMVHGDAAPYMDWWRRRYPTWAEHAESRERGVRALIESIREGYDPDRWRSDTSRDYDERKGRGPACCTIARNGIIWPMDGAHRSSILRALDRPVTLRVLRRAPGWTQKRRTLPRHPDAIAQGVAA